MNLTSHFSDPVVVIGAGLTGLTTAFYLTQQGKQVVVIDPLPQPGGVIQSHHQGPFTFESGPNTGVISNPEIAELFAHLADVCEVDIANPAAKKRWIWKGDRWRAIPSGLFSAIGTPLFSFADKIRILGEPWRKPGTNPDESLADMVRRRMGKTFLDYAVNPFIAGVYAGDPEKLVTRYAMAKLYRLEQDYGSFVRGAIKKKREPKAPNAHLATRKVFSCKGGLDNLVKALAGKIGEERLWMSSTHVKVSVGEQGRFEVSGIRHGEPFHINTTRVVTTCGAYALPDLLPFVDAADLRPVTNLTYAAVTQVVLGFEKWEGIPMQAFGGLVPGVEQREVLGILFPSSFLTDRAPKGGALLSVFMGGMRQPYINAMSDDEVMKIAEREVCQMMQLSVFRPDMVRIFRYPHAIPQYDASTTARLDAVHRIMTQYPGLTIGGNLRGGIGMADRVKQGRDMADSIIAAG